MCLIKRGMYYSQIRMCRVCVRECPNQALYFEQKAKKEDKSKWNGILVFAEQEQGEIHPVPYRADGGLYKAGDEAKHGSGADPASLWRQYHGSDPDCQFSASVCHGTL